MKNIFKKFVVFILSQEAKILLRRRSPFIIAVTGSVGKTTTKDAIYTILKSKYRVRKSEKSFNSEIGIPLTILGLPNAWNNPFLWFKNLLEGLFIALFSRDYPDYLVIEAGVDRPGDMQRLTTWLKPDVTVLTRFPEVPVHVEYFASPEEVIKEKMHLAYALKAEGILVYNHDDVLIQNELENVRNKAIGYSRYLESHFTAREDEILYYDDVPTGGIFTLHHLGQEYKVKYLGSVGLQLVYTYTGAIAVASVVGVSPEEAIKALVDHEPPNGRMRIIKGLKGTTLIDDTYNSSPVATTQALHTLGEIKHAKRKIAVLGDMMELGRFSQLEHEKVGGEAAKMVDILVTIGVRAHKIAEGALENGLHEANILQYEDALVAGRELQNLINPGDVLLIKASQSIRAEKIVEEIMAEPERASELLVRQDEEWQRR